MTVTGGRGCESQLIAGPFFRRLLPFSTVYLAKRTSESIDESMTRPFCSLPSPFKNGENGQNGIASPAHGLLNRLADERHLAEACLGGVGQHLGDVAVGDILVGAQIDLGLRPFLAGFDELRQRILSRQPLAVPEQRTQRVDGELDL